MTPEMWLDLEPILHRASCKLAADRQNPSGIQHGVALLVVWFDISRSMREGCHVLSCDVCHGWDGGNADYIRKLFTLHLDVICTTSGGVPYRATAVQRVEEVGGSRRGAWGLGHSLTEGG